MRLAVRVRGSPIKEADVGAEAVHDGADCLVIDAEAQYQGRYIAAQTYMERLRSLIGSSYPVALAGFPYVDFHPSFPYSVFLGPGRRQYNTPQMYWRDIGTSVAAVYAHTYDFNRIYQRPIFPLGQLTPTRRRARSCGSGSCPASTAPAASHWWDWQSASAKAWNAMSLPIGNLPDVTPEKAMAVVGRGASGDLVVWAQEHLVSAGFPVKISGEFKYRTEQPGRRLPGQHGLTPDGELGPDTWAALLRYKPAHVDWSLDRHLAADHSCAPRPPRSAPAVADLTLPGAAVGVRPRPPQRDPRLARRRSLRHATADAESRRRPTLGAHDRRASPPSSVVPASSVVGWSTDTDTAPSTITSAPNVTSPETTSRSASLSDGGPAGKRCSKSSISL